MRRTLEIFSTLAAIWLLAAVQQPALAVGADTLVSDGNTQSIEGLEKSGHEAKANYGPTSKQTIPAPAKSQSVWNDSLALPSALELLANYLPCGPPRI